MAWPTVVTRSAPVMAHGEDRSTSDGDHPITTEPRGHPIANVLLDAVHRHRRQKRSVRQVCESFRPATHPDEPLDVIVPRGNVLVPDRPICSDAIARVRLEVQIAHPIDLPAPDDRLPADLPRTEPVERLVRRRRVRIV